MKGKIMIGSSFAPPPNTPPVGAMTFAPQQTAPEDAIKKLGQFLPKDSKAKQILTEVKPAVMYMA
jgi:hypothetical protein